MAQPPTERRRHPRREYRAELQYRPSAAHPAQALDISESGMAFEADAPLEIGTPVELFLISGNVQVNAVVRHCEANNGGRCRIGVAFEKLEPELVQVLTAAWKAGHD
ncbi:MAG TPA: PilZ domain-containing protein [bacterium]|nr:PilZ domain-containing protein [bacterium]